MIIRVQDLIDALKQFSNTLPVKVNHTPVMQVQSFGTRGATHINIVTGASPVPETGATGGGGQAPTPYNSRLEEC